MTITQTAPSDPDTSPVLRPRRGLAPLAAATGCVAAAIALAVAAVRTRAGQEFDQELMLMLSLRGGIAGQLAEAMTSSGIVVFALACVTVAIVAACLRPVRGAIPGILVMFVGANLTTQTVKHLLARPDLIAGASGLNSFPSGHATLACGAVCALLLAPPTWLTSLTLPPAAVGATLIGVGVIAAGWHRPSDVVGAALVAAAWTLAVTGVLRLARRSGSPADSGGRTRRSFAPETAG